VSKINVKDEKNILFCQIICIYQKKVVLLHSQKILSYMSERIINKINSYFATQPIAKVWLFGSFARGEQKRNSDVDLLVEFEKDAHIGFRYAGIVCELEDLLHRKVDLVVDGNILSFAQRSVNKDKKLIYERAKI